MALRHTQVLLTELPMQKVAVQGLERHLLGDLAGREAAALGHQDARRLRKAVREVIDEGIREGVCSSTCRAKLATKPFFGALNWATVWYSQRRLQSAEAIDDIAHTLAAFAMRGLLKDPRMNQPANTLTPRRSGMRSRPGRATGSKLSSSTPCAAS